MQHQMKCDGLPMWFADAGILDGGALNKEQEATPPTVFVLDANEAARTKVHSAAVAAGMHVRSYSSAGSFLAEYAEPCCGCLILEVTLPDMCGFALQERLKSERIDLPVVFLTDKAHARLAVRAIRGGSVDFLKKPVPAGVLQESLLQATALHRRRRAWESRLADYRSRFDQLTLREMQVFSLIVTGTPNKAVGRRLQISEGSVETYRFRMMEKLEARSVADLVRISIALHGRSPPLHLPPAGRP